jgi:hypothetical protein
VRLEAAGAAGEPVTLSSPAQATPRAGPAGVARVDLGHQQTGLFGLVLDGGADLAALPEREPAAERPPADLAALRLWDARQVFEDQDRVGTGRIPLSASADSPLRRS